LSDADEQLGKPAVAEQVVQIPYDDTFDVMARYEQSSSSREFTVEVNRAERCWRRSVRATREPENWG